MKWELIKLSEFSSLNLFEYLKLRQAVFVVEQTCPYPDIDETDLSSHHLMGWQDDQLAACARIVPPGVSYEHPSIGRIATRVDFRMTGLGRDLVGRSIEHTQRLYPNQNIKIGAQSRLEKFYQSFGFETSSAIYIEDDIPHIHMILSSK